MKIFLSFLFSLFFYFNYAQWACYPLASGGSVVCGWACYSGHQGQDWQYTPGNTSYGQNIYAVDGGTVVYIETGNVGCDDPFLAGGLDWSQPSNKIIIQHWNGLYTRYVHIIDVVPGIVVGSVVNRGQVIAYVGNVGPISPCDNSNPNVNAHLHFEVGTGWSGNTLTGRYDPVSIFDGCTPPFCCGSSVVSNNNCNGTFEDTGGPNATYSNNENYIYTIAPSSGGVVTVNFNWLDIESGYDFIYVYDGPTIGASLIGTYTGNGNPGTIVSSGNSITFQFTSDVNTLAQGWNASWSCASLPPANLNVTNNSCPNNDVVLNWQNAGTNWYVDVSTDPGFSTFFNKNVTGLTSTPAPILFCDFPACTNYLSFQPNTTYYWRVWDGATLTNGAPFTLSTCSSTITTCSGNLEDTGGLTGNYSDNEDFISVIEPSGQVIITANFTSFDVELNYDTLYIYDGNSTAATLIGAYTGNNSPGTIVSTGGALCFRFRSDVSINGTGWLGAWNCTSTVGIDPSYREEKELFKIYPNPSSGVFTLITNTKSNNNAKAEIIDLLGNLIKTFEINNQKTEVDLSFVTNGVYCLKYFADGKAQMKKIVVQ